MQTLPAIFTGVFCAFLLSISTNLSHAQYNTENLAPAMAADVAQQFRCEKLRLYPILANDVFRQAHSGIARTVPMNKALSDGRLKITEHSDGAQVNTLQAHNTSTDTIYLMQGEVVVGGQQDRMLAQDVLVLPGATMDIGAFCVEHGRWSENGDGQSFTGTVGVVSQDVRKVAAVTKEQTVVWEKVRRNVDATKSEAPTGSYTSLEKDKEFTAEREAYRSKLKGLPSSSRGVVGVIAVSGNKVVGCDVFANETMFAQAYAQLIDAYITEALNNGGPVTMTDAELQAYFKELFSDEKQLENKAKDKGYLFKEGAKTYRVSMF